MPQENVEVARRVLTTRQDEIADLLDPAVRLVVFTRERGRGRSSGVEVDRRIAFLGRLRGGRVSEIRLYQDGERALRDAGLEK
jgi:hypothetical protein